VRLLPPRTQSDRTLVRRAVVQHRLRAGQQQGHQPGNSCLGRTDATTDLVLSDRQLFGAAGPEIRRVVGSIAERMVHLIERCGSVWSNRFSSVLFVHADTVQKVFSIKSVSSACPTRPGVCAGWRRIRIVWV
jgi:hypothetical protein